MISNFSSASRVDCASSWARHGGLLRVGVSCSRRRLRGECWLSVLAPYLSVTVSDTWAPRRDSSIRFFAVSPCCCGDCASRLYQPHLGHPTPAAAVVASSGVCCASVAVSYCARGGISCDSRACCAFSMQIHSGSASESRPSSVSSLCWRALMLMMILSRHSTRVVFHLIVCFGRFYGLLSFEVHDGHEHWGLWEDSFRWYWRRRFLLL